VVSGLHGLLPMWPALLLLLMTFFAAGPEPILHPAFLLKIVAAFSVAG